MNNAVLWEFIEEERNNILKEYRFSVLDSAGVGLVAHETLFVLGENLYRPLVNGFGMGEDSRDVFDEALKWWDAELSHIGAALGSQRRSW